MGDMVCRFITSNPMKYFNKVFDIFLYEGVFIFLFSSVLSLLNDRNSNLFFSVGVVSIIIAATLGVTGYLFNLFIKDEELEEADTK